LTGRERYQRSGTNRKCVFDFLLARHFNIGPILHPSIDIADFCAPDVTPILP